MSLTIRPVQRGDLDAWMPLWDGYNAFYGRSGPTALPAAITQRTWERFFAPEEPVFAFVALQGDRMVGLTHYLFHRSTTREADVCYLQDLFTAEDQRGHGIGRALIAAVARAARAAGSTRVYWQTHTSNQAGRLLYDKVAQHHGFIVYAQDL